MKKLLLSLLFALVSLTCLQAQTIWDGTADTEWYNETSTEFEIYTAEQLSGLAELVNNGNDFSGKTILLTANIVLNDTSDWEDWENSAPENTWTPIGANWNVFFSGTFDGQGHTVSGIYINSSDYGYQGLFGYNSGTIKNVGLTNSYIKGDDYVGGVCGQNEGTISNCYNSGTVSGNRYVGGVCSRNYVTISNCYNSGTVSGNDWIGGVCGYNYGTGTISNCYNSGTINVTGEYSYAGGICGDNSNSSTISNCYYLEDSAIGGINRRDKSGQAEAMTAEQFASGEVCWLLNDNSDANPTWFQTLGTDNSPLFDNTHGTVYATGNCPNSATYDNAGPSHVGEHADNDHDFRCDYCGMVMLQEPELSEGVYQISNLAELYWFAGLINGTLDGIKQNPAANAVLTADITINENVLDANGNLTENSENLLVWEAVGVDFNYSFSGTFDGKGHTVSGIYINSENNDQGLFCYNDGTIKNVGVTKSYIMGGSTVGGVCGWNDGSISNCYNSGTVSGNSDNVGGVCGYNPGAGSISNCYNLGKVNSATSSVGGVCGLNYGTISNCYYLENSASGGIHGNDESGKAEVKTAEQFASGEVCWLLNGSSDENPTWFQAINTDDSPVLDNTHGTVYATGNCPNSATYDNAGPSHVGEHADNDHDFRCDYCGMVMLQEPELSEGVYQINNLAELYWFAGLVNGSLSGVEQNREANAVLTSDITINENVLDANGDLTENTENLLIWKAIGFNYSNSFYGTFDGQGHTVSGIYINSENDYQGLFGCNKGTIKNLGVTENYIKGDDYVGGVCGENYGGTVSNCYNSGTVRGDWYVGGVCGYNYNSSGTISNCYNSGTVRGDWYVGGVCGYKSNSSTISNCYYLEGTADGGIYGSDKSGQAEVKTAEQFASGEVCWLLNGSSDANPTWFQTINTDDSPVLDNTHGTVYAIGNCPGSIIYNNDSGPSHIGEHADNDHDFRCDYCGMVMLQEPELSEGVYQISNLAELYWFAGLVNGSLDGIEQSTAANAVLTADIIINENVLDANGNLTENTENLLIWIPIGDNSSNPFSGTFDGQGHTVSGIYINTENPNQGLFGRNSGTIKNVGVAESYIKGGSYVGGVCGYNYGTISNCYNSGTVSGDMYVGGMCGYNYGTISNCYNSGEVSGNYYVGGVCGNNWDGTISNCYNSGTVNGNESVGGVCGFNYDTISNCYYLQGTATGGINSNEVSGQAEVRTTEQFASGEVCWLLNGRSDKNPIWFQTLYTDDYPVLDDAHNIVYAKSKCTNSKDNTYSNQGPSQVGAHTDNDNDGRCDFCGKLMTQEPAQKDGVYQICNRAELYWFAELVNGTLSGVEQNNSAYAVLTADIIINENVLNAEGNLTESTDNLLVWSPIGNNKKVFYGSFDGQGHTVSGIYINSDEDYQGLFGCNSGTIKNVGITESYIKGNSCVGGVCGGNIGTISNCYNSGKVSGGWNVGGICGLHLGTISNCYNSGTVSGNEGVGGVCGYNEDGTISNCYNIGKVSGGYSVGSVCGYNLYGTISNCYYLDGTADGGIYGSDVSGQAEVKTAEQFASGEVCWLLNEEQSEGAWGQKLGTDPCPVLGGPAVFKDGETYYNEEGSAIVETNSEQASFVIVSENLTIKIYGNDHEATVYNLAGNIVYKGSERIIPVTTAGMYLVRIGNEIQKTVVR